MTTFDFLVCLSILGLVGYSYFLWQAILGWIDLPKKKYPEIQSRPISVVVPFRNEGQNLKHLEANLLSQLPVNYELIWVDDHSENAVELNSGVLLLLKDGVGKKAALKLGIQFAKYEHVLTLDADVRLPDGFFEALKEAWTNEDLFICPVHASGNNKWQRFLSLESAAVMGLTVGLASMGDPIMANGAAMGLKKTIWIRHSSEGQNYASGDDMFLLQAVKRDGGSIGTSRRPNLIVETDNPLGWKSFMNQRLRWVGKAKGLTDSHTRWFGGLLLLLYTSLLTAAFFTNVFWQGLVLLGIFMAKAGIDYLLLFLVLREVKSGASWWMYPLLSLFYPLYAIGLPAASLFYKPMWKGRKV